MFSCRHCGKSHSGYKEGYDCASKHLNDRVLELALRKLSEHFDEVIGKYLDGTLTKGDIAKARGYLPPYCKYAYKRLS